MKSLLSPFESITTNQVIDAIKAGFPVLVMINGEYYTYNPDTNETTENPNKRRYIS